jgi:hypothetical protein
MRIDAREITIVSKAIARGNKETITNFGEITGGAKELTEKSKEVNSEREEREVGGGEDELSPINFQGEVLSFFNIDETK